MKTNKISIKNRKIKLKDKYSRKHIGGMMPGPPHGPPPLDNPFRPELVAPAMEGTERLRQGLGMSQIKTIQNELFDKLNTFNDEQIRNLTTPMINAVKRLSSKTQTSPQETDRSDDPNQITIEEELDRFLILLDNSNIYANQIYNIDEYLQTELSIKSTYSKYNPMKYLQEPMDIFTPGQLDNLKQHINTTKNLPNSSNKFKDKLIKLLSAIERNMQTRVKSILF